MLPSGSSCITAEYFPNGGYPVGMRNRSCEGESICTVDGTAACGTLLDIDMFDHNGTTSTFTSIQREICNTEGYSYRTVRVSDPTSR